MIPLILSDSATSTPKHAPQQDALADTHEAISFGDVMTDADVSAIDLQKSRADGMTAETDAERLDLDAKTVDPQDLEKEPPVLVVPLDDQSTKPHRTAEVPHALVATRPPQTAPPETARNALDTATDAKVATTAKGDVAELPASESKDRRSSVAQSVMEGKLPQIFLKDALQSNLTSAPATRKVDVDQPVLKAALHAVATEKTALPAVGALPKVAMTPGSTEISMSRWTEPANGPAPVPVSKSAISPSTMAQPPAVALAQLAVQHLPDTSEKVVKTSLSEVTITSVLNERPIATTPTQAAPMTATSDTARSAGTQIAVAVSNMSGKTSEISLNPEELGRVRLSLSATDGAITLNVVAERPETQDLLRRHMDLLAQEFRQLGYTSISFSFGDQNSEARSDEGPRADTTDIETQDLPETSTILSELKTSGLDLRI